MFPVFPITDIPVHVSLPVHYTTESVSIRCRWQRTCWVTGGMGVSSLLTFSAQSKDSGAKLQERFDSAVDPNNPNDLGPVAEPLSACLLTHKRAVLVGTSTLGLS